MSIPTIIRLILTTVLIYFIYAETGVATVIFCILITVKNEIQNVQKSISKDNDIKNLLKVRFLKLNKDYMKK